MKFALKWCFISQLKVHLTKLADATIQRRLGHFEALANADRMQRYNLVADPSEADIVLVTDIDAVADRWWRREALFRHPLIRARSVKTFVFCDDDRPFCMYQGLYCSMPSRFFNSMRQRAVPYVGIKNPYIQAPVDQIDEPTEYLFSFAGSRTALIRNRILKIEHQRGWLEDTSGFWIFDNQNKSLDHEKMRHYASVMRQSKYILCPRGYGTSSYRIFEALACGRVPVIISDQWVEPKGPDWKKISIRIRERDAAKIPSILERAEIGWSDMAAAAEAAFEEWFAPDIMFHRLIESCLDLQAGAYIPESIWRWIPEPLQLVYRIRNRAQHIRRKFSHGRSTSKA